MKGFFQSQWQVTEVIPEGWLVAAYNLSALGHPLLLCVPEAVLNEVLGTQDMGIVWPQTRVDTPYRAKLFERTANGVQAYDLAGLSVRALFVDILPEQRAIVCGARARHDSSGAEANATIFDLGSGQPVTAFTLGDGIGQLQAIEDGSIFVGYFDQGIEGALGWQNPLGAAGLVRFDQKGELLWQFPSSPKLAPMDDCYALNALQEETWVYYYRDFSLVRFNRAGSPDVAWNLGVEGAHALAVVPGYAALFGSYEDSRDCTLLRLLPSGAADEIHQFQLPLPPKAQIVARGGRYGALSGSRWLGGDLNHLISALERTRA